MGTPKVAVIGRAGEGIQRGRGDSGPSTCVPSGKQRCTHPRKDDVDTEVHSISAGYGAAFAIIEEEEGKSPEDSDEPYYSAESGSLYARSRRSKKAESRANLGSHGGEELDVGDLKKRKRRSLGFR